MKALKKISEQFDDALLNDYAHAFYGYGNYAAASWFVGMEEGGGNSFEDISLRFSSWADRGRPELEDLASYHADLGVPQFFGQKPKLQSTWSKLIRIYLNTLGQIPTKQQVVDFQATELGRSGGPTCLLELLPLPSPSTDHWLYSDYSALPQLASRESYKEAYLSVRIAHLHRRIIEYAPPVVVFYGTSYKDYWQEVAGRTFVERNGAWFCRSKSTVFAIAKHPTSVGVSNAYFDKVGQAITNEMQEKKRGRFNFIV